MESINFNFQYYFATLLQCGSLLVCVKVSAEGSYFILLDRPIPSGTVRMGHKRPFLPVVEVVEKWKHTMKGTTPRFWGIWKRQYYCCVLFYRWKSSCCPVPYYVACSCELVCFYPFVASGEKCMKFVIAFRACVSMRSKTILQLFCWFDCKLFHCASIWSGAYVSSIIHRTHDKWRTGKKGKKEVD